MSRARSVRQEWSDLALMEMLDRRVTSFHTDHIVRMNNLLAEDRPSVSLLIGECLAGQQPHLFRSMESVISEVAEYCSVGIGQYYADAMLHRIGSTT